MPPTSPSWHALAVRGPRTHDRPLGHGPRCREAFRASQRALCASGVGMVRHPAGWAPACLKRVTR
jgi:hypothetical protein